MLYGWFPKLPGSALGWESHTYISNCSLSILVLVSNPCSDSIYPRQSHHITTPELPTPDAATIT